MLFGTNEPGVQHFHRTLNDLMATHHVEGHPLPRTADA